MTLALVLCLFVQPEEKPIPACVGDRLKHENRLAKGGGGKDTDDAVLAALRWLARHQSDDGSWRTRTYNARCTKEQPCGAGSAVEAHDVGATGLALLAFLGAGHSRLSKEPFGDSTFGDVVRKGIAWLLS